MEVDEEQLQAQRAAMTTLLLALELFRRSGQLASRQMVLLGHVERSARELMRAMLETAAHEAAEEP